MKRIWKYSFNSLPRAIFNIPIDAKFLDCQTQNRKICLWFLVDPSNKTEEREFWAELTGLEGRAQDEGEYLGTIQIDEYVAHIFEAKL